MCTAFRNIIILLVCCTAFTILAVSAFARGGMHHDFPDSPHNTTNNILCSACHDFTSPDPKFIPLDLDPEPNIDDTRYNSLCKSCHYSGSDAPVVKTHSSLNTSDRYGNWTVECWVCHSQHRQEEAGIHTTEKDVSCVANAAALLYSGVTTAVTNGVDEATITVEGAGWPEDGLVGMRIAPDIGQDPYCHWNYKIVSNTVDTLTVEGLIDLDEDGVGIDTGIVAGHNYGIFLGKLMPDYIDLPWITDPLNPKPNERKYPKLYRREGANSYADNDDTVYDGICEVCHTETNHFRHDGSAPQQWHENLFQQPVAGTNCIRCHRHEDGFAHSGGPGTGCVTCHGHDAGSKYDPDMKAVGGLNLSGTNHPGRGTVQSHSTHTESNSSFDPADDDDLKGPGIYCDTCHNIDSIPSFKPGVAATDANNDGLFDLSETNVCDPCHSKNGTYDGINDPVIGVKKIWKTGAYVATNDSHLRNGKEKWCAGCHDEDPSNSKADGSGVNAPNVVGDEDGGYPYGTGWGYYKTGHGLAAGVYPASEAPAADQPCSGCHDFATSHIDGSHRTYLAASNNYQAGYRLKLGMDIPRPQDFPPIAPPQSDFTLCFSCHDTGPFLTETDFTTNFRSAGTNAHYYHINHMASSTWDSDWDGSTGDSRISCPACHNVHGSPSPRMVRHGELISTPGTTDKVPAIEFKYTPSASYPTLMNSTGGTTRFYGGGAGTVAKNGICSMCHNDSITYTRTPNDLYAGLPAAPTIGAAVAQSTTSIRWNFTDNASNETGFRVHDVNHAIKASAATPNLTYLDETGLTANTQYSRHVHAYNGDGNSAGSADATKYTLSPVPNVTANKATSTWYNTTNVIFTNAAGFGEGGVQYYRYVWDQNATYAFTDTETQWSSSTLVRTATAIGSWYLHVKSYNGDNVGNGTQNYGPYYYEGIKPSASSLNPANGATNVALDVNLTFTLSDANSGVDWTTFRIRLTGDKGYAKTYTDLDTGIVSKVGTAASYDVTVNPDAVFSNDEVITVTVSVNDAAGNALTPPAWSFATGTATGVPAAPTIGTPSALSTTSIRWYFADNAGNEDGFKVHDASQAIMASSATPNLTYLDETGLTANTQYTRHVHAYNGEGDSADSADASRYTLSVASDVTANKSISTWYATTDVIFTNAAGFGAGGVQYYRYAWDQNATYAFTDTETQWSSGTLTRTATASGNWYLHVKSYNGDNIGSGTQDYGPYFYDGTAPAASALNPANGATNVAVNANQTFTLSDGHSGVDWTTFQIQLSGNKGYAKTYTDLDVGIVIKTGTPASYDVTVDPDADFANSEVITVTVSVNDSAGNAMAPPTWSFTTIAAAQTMTIHPSGLATEGAGLFAPTGGTWDTVLDSNDGDTSYASYCCSGTISTFYVDMDDPAIGSGATINSVTVKVVVKNGASINVNMGYKTGSATIWKGNTSVGTTYTTLTLNAPTDSDGGAWSLTDLNNLKVAVTRNYSGPTRCYVTEVYVEIIYTP